MTRRNRGRRPPSRDGMLEQLQQMQQQMAETQAALEHEELEVSVGGGALRITITGHQRIRAIHINPDALDMDDEEWLGDLQDLLVAAMNQAIEQSQSLSAQKLEGITGSLGDMSLDNLLPR